MCNVVGRAGAEFHFLHGFNGCFQSVQCPDALPRSLTIVIAAALVRSPQRRQECQRSLALVVKHAYCVPHPALLCCHARRLQSNCSAVDLELAHRFQIELVLETDAYMAKLCLVALHLEAVRDTIACWDVSIGSISNAAGAASDTIAEDLRKASRQGIWSERGVHFGFRCGAFSYPWFGWLRNARIKTGSAKTASDTAPPTILHENDQVLHTSDTSQWTRFTTHNGTRQSSEKVQLTIVYCSILPDLLGTLEPDRLATINTEHVAHNRKILQNSSFLTTATKTGSTQH
jgi:hypothetical protein